MSAHRTHQGQDHVEYGDPASSSTETRPGASHSRASHQQFSNLTAQESSRFHAGNSYVEHQNHYYAPMTSRAQIEPDPVLERFMTPDTLLRALEFPEVDLRFANIEKEFPGTCTWLKHTKEYKRWINPLSQNGILWIKGVPGAGKSTIMRCAFLDNEPDNRKHIKFFFNARGCKLEKSTEGMFRALLCQLLEDETGYTHWMVNSVRRSQLMYYREHGWPLALLKNLFHEAVECYSNSPFTKPVVCYIDALDECAEDEARELLEYFADLGQDRNLDLLVCFASRPYPNIGIYGCQIIVLEERTEHTDDIRKYALSRLRLGGLVIPESDYHRELVSEVIERSAGVFLWVVLVTTQLKRSADRGVHRSMLREHLLEFPLALGDIFDAMMGRYDTFEYLLPLVQWVLFAQGRMRAADLCMAVQCSSTGWPFRSVSDDKTWLSNFILTGSKGFLKMIDTTNGSYMPCEFIHESVREYFLDGGLQKLDPSLGSNVVAASHARLARICQRYLDTAANDLPAPEKSIGKRAVDGFDALDPYPLLGYIRDKAAFLHAEIAERGGVPQADFCEKFDFGTWLTLSLHYPRPELAGQSFLAERLSEMLSNQWTTLHVLVENQLESLIQRELQRHAADDPLTLENYLNAQCGGLGTTLHLAVDCNNTTVIRALLSSGAHVDVHCQHLGTALDYAMLLERAESVEILLQYGATTTSGLSPHQRRKTLYVRE